MFIGLVILFQFISNLKKEQAKHKKRTFGRPPAAPQAPAGPPVPQRMQARPADALVREKYRDAQPYEPAYDRDYQEPRYEPMQAPELYREPVVVKETIRTEFEEPSSEEIRKNRRIHRDHLAHKKVKLDESAEGPAYHFDMREAVVYQAILNRPEH